MKTIITTLAIFIVTTISAQEFIGKAIYKTSRKSNVKFGGENSTMSEKQTKEIEARLQKMNQKTFILQFDKSTSIYKEEVTLSVPKPSAKGVKVVSFFSGDDTESVYYKNLKEKRFANKTAIMGKPFLVKDSLPIYEWQLSSETKNIGLYTCFKASFSKDVENITTTLVNGKLEEVKKIETIVTTAWYTMQVPISNGPSTFYGLPGLILEINDGTKMIVCTEIIMNPSEKIKIEEPEKGKIVNQADFDEISEKKSKEMMERFSGREGVDIGNGVNIRMIGN
ncbi:GLPGLI family protein [Polaribacter sp. KT25b]|uniref:GLPGLI family protein n=1 Tax=Polaribacter sp. KT25b TaxID=1855336 RepID=UPI00087D8606|nr:GLPGLI family protein [Polaribacter sp. KT25b]SDR69441.1 GLPGLI family protein [Polaribacter sp. KT25b]